MENNWNPNLPLTPDIRSKASYIYAILFGDYDRRTLPPQAEWIENLFAANTPVERLYREMLEASERLAGRLHPGEEELGDVDAEIIFSNGLKICAYVSQLMYQYGAYYAVHPEDFPGRKV